MSGIQPEGEALRRAIQWVAEQRSRNKDPEKGPVKSPAALADEAAFRFDLSPRDSEFLLRFVREGGDGAAE